MLKKIIVLSVFAIQLSFAQEQLEARVGIDAGGGGRLVNDGSSRVIGIDAGGGGRVTGGIELLKLERINGTEKFELMDARPTIGRVLGSGARPSTAVKMMKLKIMADFNDISEITLKDGTVIKAEEILELK